MGWRVLESYASAIYGRKRTLLEGTDLARANFFLVVILAAGLASCTLRTEIALYNHTAGPITFVLDGRERRIEVGEIERIFADEIDNAALVINGISVTYGGNEVPIPESFISWDGWGPWTKRTARLQIEDDGRVWLIETLQSFPVTEFVRQPRGFPLEADPV